MDWMQSLLELDGQGRATGVHHGEWQASGDLAERHSPVDGRPLPPVITAGPGEAARVIAAAGEAFIHWRRVPAPRRAEVVRRLGQAFREQQEELARLITLEMGKTLVEARGEVQEMIDVCDFAVGLGRQVGGLTLPSERPGHRLQEQWHPLGPIGVVSAFNFPAAVWSWNLAVALVCGDPVVWKPSSKTPLTAIACTRIAARVLARCDQPPAVAGLVVGSGALVGQELVESPDLPLISYTGSVATGRRIAVAVQNRFGRPLLELGGNNAAIVTASADLDLALEAVLFGAIGTAGQRCTTTRRLLVQEEVYPPFLDSLERAYGQVVIGDPGREGVMMGPLVDRDAVAVMTAALERIRAEGGRIRLGGKVLENPGGCYVTPCLVEVDEQLPIVREETFAPILYAMPYRTLDEAIAIQNDVPQGLSSAIFSRDLAECEWFIGAAGSDCGLANINTGTSGAEIGGAFGGEKETGGGRESGSDSWKAYMRRQTTVINASGRLDLAQGIRFGAGGEQ